MSNQNTFSILNIYYQPNKNNHFINIKIKNKLSAIYNIKFIMVLKSIFKNTYKNKSFNSYISRCVILVSSKSIL